MMLKMTILAIGIFVASVGAEFGQKSLRAGGDCTCPSFEGPAFFKKSACLDSCQKKEGACVPKASMSKLVCHKKNACCSTCEPDGCGHK